MQDQVAMHNPADEESAVEADGGWSIGAVSRMTGIPTPTIRSWERRYQLPTTRRTPGGQRRYTTADVEALMRLRDQTAAGGRAAEAAALVREAAAAPPARLVDGVLSAALDFDAVRLRDELDRARRVHGLLVCLEEVVLPALREMGRRWAAGGDVVGHEHLISVVVQSWLGGLAQEAPPATRPGCVVLACGPDDQHSLALQAFAVLLAHRGFDCRLLGGQTPAAALAVAVTSTGASAVVVASHLEQTRPSALTALRAVDPLPCRVYYAGGAFTQPRSRAGVPGAYLGESLAAAAQRLIDDAAGESGVSRSGR
jgi:DNA-binding transcriptional MerR regulator/methylmalonyl-CoA mutase cobalamin-binding subunit